MWLADAADLPLPDGAFHVAFANHMLYHVPDRPAAIRELARVLRPDGVLVAVTNGAGHMRELWPLARPRVGTAPPGISATFSLENGAGQLGEGFADVELLRWDDGLEITEIEPVVAYIRSLPAGDAADLDAARRVVGEAIAREGAFRVTKATGLFLARSPIQSRS
jgi:SAM-dependent methyltransferase